MPPVDLIEDDRSLSRGFRALGEGLILTLLQFAFAALVGSYQSGRFDSTPERFVKSYFSLVQFDSQWYWCIAQEGYRTDKEFQAGKIGNVAFFPGYPVLVRGVQSATHWPWPICLLAVSQLSCWGFWTYFFLLASRYNASPGQARLAAILIASQPAAFFLVAGYSESFFLMNLLGFIYWTDSPRPRLRWLAALHGFAMTATRIVGLPLVAYPAFRAYLRLDEEDGGWPDLVGSVVVAGVSALGGLLFFGYCHQQFGRWDAYMVAQQQGWSLQTNYRALLEPSTYLLDLDLWLSEGAVSPDWVSRAIVPATAAILVLALLTELWILSSAPTPTTRDRIGLIVMAGAMFFVAATGLYGNQYRSMIRYVLCSYIPLALAGLHLLNNEDVEIGWGGTVVAVLVATGSFALQAMFLHRYLAGLWVA